MKEFNNIVRDILVKLEEKECEKNSCLTKDEILEITDKEIKIYYLMGTSYPGSYDLSALENPECIRNAILSQYPKKWEAPDPNIIYDKSNGHCKWLDECKNQISWKFWDRYAKYLGEKKNPLYPEAIKEIGRATDIILDHLENPKGNSGKTTKGMVVGYVQSGKTANYIGLICKAADAGFRFIIVLTGTSSALRAQTQIRIEEGFVGYDKTNGSCVVGVGKKDDSENGLLVHTFTTRDLKKGDFDYAQADVNTLFEKGGPTCIVVKKNPEILKHINDFLKGVDNRGDISKVPLLIIDDEADNASINSKKSSDNTSQSVNEITTINKGIRSILNRFPKYAYVAYTATPYANIFIDPDNYSPDVGDDLFPSDFIYSLEEPKGYFGSKQFISEKKKFAGIIPINERDYSQLFPEKYKGKDKQPFIPTITNIPESLKDAIKSFILSCCVRKVRSLNGAKRVDNAMMIHITHNSYPHIVYTELIESEVFNPLKYRVSANDETVYSELKSFWETEYRPTSEKIRLDYSEDKNCTDVSWDEIRPYISGVMDSIEFRVLNGDSDDKLEYGDEKYPDGLNVIVVGGNSISRGLTLEGLTVSYFLRDAKTYDTLLQMGRWFGYRSGYIDTCRIYTTKTILEKFKEVCKADEDLRHQIKTMNNANKRPSEFGLKIVETLKKFRATSIPKSRGTKIVKDGKFSDTQNETTRMSIIPADIESNYNIISEYIRSLGSAEKLWGAQTGYRWRGVSVDKILELIGNYRYPSGYSLSPKLSRYINSRLNEEVPELTSWTVCLLGIQDSKHICKFGNCDVYVRTRNFKPDSKNPDLIYDDKGRWTDPDDEAAYFDVENKPQNGSYRSKIPASDGLLLIVPMYSDYLELELPFIGFAISFPKSKYVEESKDYRANAVYISNNTQE